MTARYIIRVADGELFPFYPDWLKIAGMVEYNPEIHGFRSEVAAAMGQPTVADVAPAPAPAIKTMVADHVAGQAKPKAGKNSVKTTSVAEASKSQEQAELNLSDVFDAK